MTLSPPRWKLAAVENEMNNHSDHLVALETGSNEARTFPSWQENLLSLHRVRVLAQTHRSFHRTFGHTGEHR